MPADDVNDRAGRHERRDLVLVVVDRVPVVVPVGAVDRLALHDVAGIARVDQLEALILAADVHVRLPGDDLARLGVQRVAVDARHRAGRDVERVVGVRRRVAVMRRVADVLRHVALRIEQEADLDLRVDLFADRVQVVREAQRAAGLQQDARILRVDLRRLARGVLDDELRAAAVRAVRIGIRVGVGRRAGSIVVIA